jgi:hypothetical protein
MFQEVGCRQTRNVATHYHNFFALPFVPLLMISRRIVDLLRLSTDNTPASD